ncbi:MAG TPA: hypothetical protein VK034_01540 [Enhygromyxa sp.]|nr:hypothetical protein [Enhygromyxa sp.]
MAASARGSARFDRLTTIALVLAIAWLAWRTLSRVAAAWAFSTDDAFITMRYARHLLAGEGLVWNVGGPPVEGYSNFAYVLIAALLGAVGELEVAPLKLLGCAGLIATGYLQWAIARRFVRPLPAVLPFALFTLERGSFWWSVSGLETGVFVALGCGVALASLRGLGFERVELEPGEHVGLARGPIASSSLALAGALCLVASLLRPEGPIFAIAVLLAIAVQRAIDGPNPDYRRGAWAFVLAFGPALAIYVGWRYAYFGELLPNTVRCKTGHDDRFVLLRAYWSAAPLVLLVALIQPLRSLDARVVLPLAVAAGYAIALIGADPLIGHELRHFLAAHALVCVLASVAAVRLLGLVFAGLDARASELSLVVALLLGATPLGDLVTREHLRGRAGGYVVRSQTRAALGRHLARELGPGERAVLGDVGVAGWEGDAAILDAFCLNEPALAEPPLRGDPDAGAAWILDQAPELIVVHTRKHDGIDPRGAIYRRLVKDPRFKADWHEQQRFNTPRGSFNYVVFRRR